MRTSSYPHPVLDTTDDIKGSFSGVLRCELGEQDAHIAVEFSLENEGIQKCIERGEALYALRVECAGTYYRHCFDTNEPSTEFTIPQKMLDGRVEMQPLIVAVGKLAGYSPTGLHSDYHPTDHFTVPARGYLAVAETSFFEADRNFDPLKPATPSIMQVKKSDVEDGPMELSLEGDLIVILMPSRDWVPYQQGKGRGTPLLSSSIAFPALQEAVKHIKRGNEEYSDLKWYRRLEVIMADRGLDDDDDMFTVAQKLTGLPAHEALKALQLIQEEEDES